MTLEETHVLEAMGEQVRKRIKDLRGKQDLTAFTTKVLQHLRSRQGWTEEMVNAMRAWIPKIYRQTHRRGSPGRKEPPRYAGAGKKERKDVDG